MVIEGNVIHPEKTDSPIEVTELGIITDSKAKQPKNA
jgi:hypothetical protein